MKKIILAVGFCLSFISGVYANDGALEALNLEIQNILAPYQNATTVAKLAFTALETDSVRATQMGLNAYYRKTGLKNTFEFKLDNLSYSYGTGKTPTTIFKSSIGFDLTKVLGQEELNQFIPNAAEFIESIAADYSAEYGDAASVKSVVTSTSKDDADNYVGLTALISGRIDLDKLPEYMDKSDVFATDAAVSLSFNLKTGFSIEAFIIHNPEFRGFDQDQEGLKEFLDMLLAQDEEGLYLIHEIVSRIDAMADELVNIGELLKSKLTK